MSDTKDAYDLFRSSPSTGGGRPEVPTPSARRHSTSQLLSGTVPRVNERSHAPRDDVGPSGLQGPHTSAAATAATARWTAAERARESARADRLFSDPLAEKLAGDIGRAWISRMRGNGRFENPAVAIRTRFFDDSVAEVLDDARGPRQVVALAAGMDTRPYRLALPNQVTWYDVDRPVVVSEKEQLLSDAHAGRPFCERRAVGADLAADWRPLLESSGFDPLLPTLWIIEGLLMYFDEESVKELLNTVTDSSAPASTIVCDSIGLQFLRSPMTRSWLAELESVGAPWRSGTDNPGGMFAQRGWIPEIHTLAEVGLELGRWPFPTKSDQHPGFPDSFLIRARRP